MTALRLIYATLPALVILGLITYFANWIPQTRWQPPEKREITQALTPAELARLGQVIVGERGCMACHTLEPGVGVKGEGRGPNLYNLAVTRARGVSGGPSNLVAYLVESLYQPSAYLVEDYPNIMPAATAAPAKFNYEEVVAVVNYLQSLGGRPSVRIGDIPRPQGEIVTPPPSVDVPALLAEQGCLACHIVNGEGGTVGPSLDTQPQVAGQRVEGLSAEEYVRQSIVDPGAFIVPGFSNIMPGDYSSRITTEKLDALIEYLLSEER